MIEQLTDLPPDVDGLRARGRVTKEDYLQVLEPLLYRARREGRRIRLLYEFGPEFEGFTPGAAWEDARVGLQYLRLFERCAVVTDTDWIREASRFVGTMMPCPVRTFGVAERQEAIDWLSAPVEAVAVKHRLYPEEGVLVIEPERPLRREDFDAIALTVDPWIEAHGPLRGVVVRARSFPGWQDLGSLLRHLRFVRDYHRRVGRVALVADGKMAELAPKLGEHFVEADLRHFPYEEIDQAMAWVRPGA